MQHVLRAISGPHAGAVYVLGSRTTIGRASDCEIQILHEGISRHHAKLTLEEDGTMVVADLSSDNGTFIEDERIERRALRPGDVLRVMQSRFAYEWSQTDDAATSAVFRRKLTSGDSLRQTVLQDRPSATVRSGSPPGLLGGSIGERVRPYSRPQAAAPALSGARPGAAGPGLPTDDDAASHAVGPVSEIVAELPQLRPLRAQGPDSEARERWPRLGSTALIHEGLHAPGRMASLAAGVGDLPAARLVTSGPHGRSLARGQERHGRRATASSTSLGATKGSSARIERAAPSPPGGPSGRMASLVSSAEHGASVSASAPATAPTAPSMAMGGGWVRATRSLVTPGSMRPGSTVSGLQPVESDEEASPAATPWDSTAPPAAAPAAGPDVVEPRLRKPITAEYGWLGERPTTVREPVTQGSPAVPARPAVDPDAELDAMKTLPSVRRAARRGSATPTEKVPIVRDAPPRASATGDERLVDILEYRELRLRALRGQPGDARVAERCAALEQILQQARSAGDGMVALRRHHRFACSIPAQLTHGSGSRGAVRCSTVEIEDISAGGAKLRFGERAIGVGEMVWLTIELAGADRSRIPSSDAATVVMMARVVWAQPHEATLGLVFAGAPRYQP